MCDCTDVLGRQLADHNTRLAYTIVVQSGSLTQLPTILTEKIDTRRRGRPMALVPSYCPFCGDPFVSRDSNMPFRLAVCIS